MELDKAIKERHSVRNFKTTKNLPGNLINQTANPAADWKFRVQKNYSAGAHKSPLRKACAERSIGLKPTETKLNNWNADLRPLIL